MITALLVSVNYADYLEAVLPHNALQFDQIIVLTIESDKACQDLCSKYSNVKCLVFRDGVLKKNGRQFNKGAILNAGLRYLNRIKYSDWLVMTDSDILFTENFKELLLSKDKDSKKIYGMKRKDCYSLKALEQYLKTKNDTLLMCRKNEGAFIGFCQIFMYQANKFNLSEDFDAERSDRIFLSKFFIRLGVEPEMLSETDFVIHLGENAKNWKGRITKQFA